jgi:hypothetical protein
MSRADLVVSTAVCAHATPAINRQRTPVIDNIRLMRFPFDLNNTTQTSAGATRRVCATDPVAAVIANGSH